MHAHILVCFLTYVVWKCFGQMCKQAGLGNEPRKVIEEIKRLKMVDIVLPLRNGKELRLRRVSKPEKELQVLMSRLKLTVPENFDRMIKM